MTDEVVPHFHNEPGVPVIEIGAKKFMCRGALPPQDRPHVFCDMGEDAEYVCPYCSTFFGTILHWRRTKHAQRNVNSTTFCDDDHPHRNLIKRCGAGIRQAYPRIKTPDETLFTSWHRIQQNL
jgi:uncharacterized Zn-finger protein